MRVCVAWLAVFFVAAGGAAAQAQPPGVAVQLPTFSHFSSSSTVVVPDRGSAYLGGIKRAATGRNEFGTPWLPFRPFRNSAIGSERSASSLRVTATIHDFDAMEDWLESQPTSISRSLRGQQPASAIAALGKTLQPRNPAYGQSWKVPTSSSSAARPTMSLAEAQSRRLRLQATRSAEANDLFQRGQKAEAAGKTNVAKIYYQMAGRRASGELQTQIAARLQSLGLAQTANKIAQSRP